MSKNSLLVRGHVDDGQQPLEGLDFRPDLRSYTIWDTIKNTIVDENRTLYLVLDEAHRGVGTPTKNAAVEKSTIVSRLVNGHAGVPPSPVVWGISATVARFDAAMKAAEASSKRVTLPRVEVDAALVQASGLLKDDIVLDIPAESGQFDTVLLKRATRKIIESTSDWAGYAADEGGAEPVLPLMVLQSPNTPSKEMLRRALDTIYEEWADLSGDAVAHVFGEHATQTYGPWRVPYIFPERVQEATHIRVLIAKDAISTGWDCPRAEVLVSFRPARDETHITQLLGRMVRTPLARRIPGNERLNAVDCLLPYFDRKTATSVARVLMGFGDDPTDPKPPPDRRVLIDPQKMTPNPLVKESVWACLDSLPTQSLPKLRTKPVKRVTALAQALATDGLRPNAGKQAHAELHAVLDGTAARYKARIEKAVTDVLTAEGETVKASKGVIGYTAFSEAADDRVIEDAFRSTTRVLSADLARTYAEHLAGPDTDEGDNEELRNAHVRVAALGLLPEIKADLEAEADKIAVAWLTAHRVGIKGLSDERQGVYNELAAMSREPQRILLARPKNRLEETKRRDAEGEEHNLPIRKNHLLSNGEGDFPVGSLNQWELAVLDNEMRQPGAVAWYRNPARAAQDSLAVAYKNTQGDWKAMRPDFLFFTQRSSGEVVASLVDPHGWHLSDALPKLRGLADFAEEFGSEFQRIESVAEVDKTLRVLDVTRKPVRDAIRSASDARSLYAGDLASDY